MGAICSRSAVVDKSPSDTSIVAGALRDRDLMDPPAKESMVKGFHEQAFSFSDNCVSPKPKIGATKVSDVSSLLGRAGTVGLGKAVDVLDTLGSSMTGLSLGSGFEAGVATKGNKISILSFEVANTIVKGAKLMQSLSAENIKHLKEVVLNSQGVQLLICKDTDDLLKIAATDKREELKIFSGEVVRFGNRCKDPQWHNLERYFAKLESDATPQKQLKKEATEEMKRLMSLVQHTAELYHELHSLDRFEQDYRRRHLEEESSNAAQRGDNLQILRQELKIQRKHVDSLKKKSLWSKILDEIMEMLVDIVHFLHLEIQEAFGGADGVKPVKRSINNHQSLGSAGLALHYANVVNQIDNLVSRSSSVPSNMRDALYQGLPPRIKIALRSKLQSSQVNDELTVTRIRSEIENTLQWLLPFASNTTKAYHGFGWVGEWASSGTDLDGKESAHSNLTRIETLYHADKEKTEAYILDLVVWLHHLIILSRASTGGMRSLVQSPMPSLTGKNTNVSLPADDTSQPALLSQEEHEMLQVVSSLKHTPGISKSQEFDTGKPKSHKKSKLSKSISHSPISETMEEEPPSTRTDRFVDFDIDRIKALDAIDRVDTLRNL
ncbi:uncharacterized protein M6B38_398430 [Iris pallida]|uniref:Uncharacterized protein n=1 Tax=Iris pallida TaxID=29817 RepID=A0AAX6FVV5_IRIPA|nr:uncharacterized protein M6B38_398430 [Iris pallida]